MKYLLSLIVFSITASTFTFDQSTQNNSSNINKKAEQEIRDILARFYDVSILNNKDAFLKLREQYMDKDSIYISTRGSLRTHKESIERIHQTFAANQKLDVIKTDDMHIRTFGDTAFATYVVSYSGQRDNKPISVRARVTMFFAKRDGKWLNVLEHATEIPAPNQQQTTTTNKPQ